MSFRFVSCSPLCPRLKGSTLEKAFTGRSVRWASRACYQNAKRKYKNEQKMVNPKKSAIASDVKDVFQENNLVTVFHYNDLTASEWRNLRLKFSESNIKVRVFPSKISSKVLSSTPYKNIAPLFRGCTAVAMEKDGEPSTVSRLLSDSQKEDKLILLGGMVDRQMLTPERLKTYSKAPTVDVLRQELVSILNKSQVALKQTLDSPSQRLSSLLEQVSKSDS